MKVKIFSCLFAFVLGCNVTAEIQHRIVKEKTSITLSCPHTVEGNVTWSTENRQKGKVDILTVDGDREEKHIPDPDQRYRSLADKALRIDNLVLSDSGKYFCNNESVTQLMVIPPEIQQRIVKEKTSITLSCPHTVEGKVTWSTENRQKGKVDILTVDGDREEKHIPDPDQRYRSLADKALQINNLVLSDSGKYFCNNESVMQLTVISPEM
ncbi:uncharacterized protein LOC121191601 [Toxotes jaculatrix]|uniref:uncharacterized protein LOC121191601 n=1 Tax=Toxotes jaculatrix TaxID=941984 RepID=UPI001B3AF649|nr:uncharacterized protein LOC121191601 [Toxotes jaculatrix]